MMKRNEIARKQRLEAAQRELEREWKREEERKKREEDEEERKRKEKK